MSATGRPVRPDELTAEQRAVLRRGLGVLVGLVDDAPPNRLGRSSRGAPRLRPRNEVAS